MMTPRPRGAAQDRKLRALLDRLSAADRATVLAFAEFLASRAEAGQEVGAEPAPEPVPEPRPESESVVGAIKRLSRTYPMLEKSEMLNETSALMSQHVVQGRPPREVIDELEALFRRAWERKRAGDPR